MKKILITAVAAIVIAGTPTAASAQTPTKITLIQGIPTPPNVDVEVDGSTVAGSTNLAQGSVIDATNYAGLQFQLEVFETGTTSSVMALETVSAPGSGNNSVVLTKAGVMSFENNMSEVVDGNARITVRNTSTDVDSITLVGTTPSIDDVMKGGEGSIDRPFGQLAGARIIDAAGDPLVDVPTINLALGTNAILYLIGDETGYSVVQQVIDLPITSTNITTTTIAGGSTTSTTSTTSTSSTSTTSTSSTSTTSTAVPIAVNTGSPIDDSNSVLWVLIVVGGIAVAGGAYLVRRKV